MCSVGQTLWQEDFFFNVALRPQRPYRLTRTSTSTFTKPLSSADLWVQVLCCFTSTETTKTVRDVEPWTATSTFTQRLNSLTALFCFFCSVALCPQRPHGLLGTSTRTSTSTLTQLLNSDDQRTRTGLFLFFFFFLQQCGGWSLIRWNQWLHNEGITLITSKPGQEDSRFILRLHIGNLFCCCCCWWWWWWCLVCSHLSCFVVVCLFVLIFSNRPPPPPPHTQNHTHNNNNKKDCLTVSVIGRRSTVAGWTVRCEPGF